MRFRTVAAEDVRVGDEIYNRQATHTPFRWCRVIRIELTTVQRSFNPADGSYQAIKFTTSGWETLKHPKEGVAIRR